MSTEPVERSEDVVIALGDSDAHVHAWRSTGVDEQGGHDVVCVCGETGYGYGDFEEN